jgi:hypothetical protein
MRIMKESGRAASNTFVCPDYVEEKIIPRQNFCAEASRTITSRWTRSAHLPHLKVSNPA